MNTEELIRIGAQARLAMLDVERGELLKLLDGQGALMEAPTSTGAKKRKPLSAAQRAKLSRKMKALWKARKAANT